ncbi:AP-1 complex subunit sigma-2 isoform X2 [Hyperolius riggenbachi]|uniref:AP-1 complex subunit sigma-2 isoform X2 n=1 Tax=Hyperolius riggenbachi TaxID=752182 RepID=UPI0035A2676D
MTSPIRVTMQFMLLFSRQGKLRLQKWYVPLSDKEKKKITRELVQTVLARKPKMCSFLEWRDLKIVYKRYASLYFCCAIEDQDNELITLEIIHRYVELLDKYFGSVCELDIIFNFEKAYFILDEFLLGGEVQETSKKNVLKAIEQADLLQEVCLLCRGAGRAVDYGGGGSRDTEERAGRDWTDINLPSRQRSFSRPINVQCLHLSVKLIV